MGVDKNMSGEIYYWKNELNKDVISNGVKNSDMIGKSTVDKDVTCDDSVKDGNDIMSYNYSRKMLSTNLLHVPDIRLIKPCGFVFAGRTFDVCGSWIEWYMRLIRVFYEEFGSEMVHFKDRNGKKYFSINSFDLIQPRLIAGHMFAETQLANREIMPLLRDLMKFCKLDTSELTVIYMPRDIVPSNEVLEKTNQKQEILPLERVIKNKETSTSRQNNRGEIDDIVKDDDKEDKQEIDNRVVNDNIYQKIIKRYFSSGYRLGSILSYRKFSNNFEDESGKKLNRSDKQLEQDLRQFCVEYDGKLYSVVELMNVEFCSQLDDYISRYFDSGKSVLYYSSIFNSFETKIGDKIYNADMLAQVLKTRFNNKYLFSKDYLSNVRYPVINHEVEIKDALIAQGKPMRYDELMNLVGHIPTQQIVHTLKTDHQFVRNAKSVYFHVSICGFSQEELADISSLIDEEIKGSGFVAGNEIFDIVMKQYPHILERMPWITSLGFRNALQYYLEMKFSFNGNIICSLSSELDMKTIFAKYAKNHLEFTLEELNALAENLGTHLVAGYLDSVYENAVRISENKFVGKNLVNFDIVSVDKQIAMFFDGDYVALRDISFVAFPYVGYVWNIYLLESYVGQFSAEFKLMHSNYSQTKTVGAIVRRSSNFEKMDDLVIEILADSGVELIKEKALEYLCEAGYYGTHRGANMENLLIKARERRNQKK